MNWVQGIDFGWWGDEGIEKNLIINLKETWMSVTTQHSWLGDDGRRREPWLNDMHDHNKNGGIKWTFKLSLAYLIKERARDENLNNPPDIMTDARQWKRGRK